MPLTTRKIRIAIQITATINIVMVKKCDELSSVIDDDVLSERGSEVVLVVTFCDA